MAEALLEESLQENMDLLRSSTPLMDKTQPKLCRAKGHLNAILSRGRLTVSLIWVILFFKEQDAFYTNILLCVIAEPFISSRPPAQVLKRGSAADGQSALCAGSLPGRPGNVCQGGTGGADTGRAADLPPPPAG